jgi:ribonuclease Z
MTKVIILGSASAVPDEQHENSHMVVVGRQNSVLIDCVGKPLLRLRAANVNPDTVSDLILTHFHPDHVSGVPLMLMDMWLQGRKKPLAIYGLADTLDRTEKMMALYTWENWPGFFPVTFHRLPAEELTTVINYPDLRIYASPVQHLIPTIGLRIEYPWESKVIAYSCDTEPCQQVVHLAKGADVLIHEATGLSSGHTSATAAGDIASQAGVKVLYLIHYPTAGVKTQKLFEDAQRLFPGTVRLAEDLVTVDDQN